METKIANSVEETKRYAKEIAKDLKPPQIITLQGSLGSGKTTFIQGLAVGLGIKKRILSPTFVFIRQYQLERGNKFYHVDLYRLDSEQEVESIGLSDILEDKDAIIAIEWPEKIKNLLPEGTIEIKFKTLGQSKREILILHPT